jgi:glutamyl-Q tRNA(Asp) synthetase
MSAVLAHDHARARGGRFVLRIEDTDPGRTREEFVAGIMEDLRWLGLGWDGPVVRQSQRLALYAAALERLREKGLIYPCFCTRADIARSVSAPHGPEGPLYPGTCRGLAAPDLERPHAWRLDVAKAVAVAGPLTWTDAHAGRVRAQPELLGDVVLARKDAPVSYHLAVTIDDADQGVTDVIRGRDLFLSTHVHRLLQALLGLETPGYQHHPLILGPDGARLAKRHGALSLAELRAQGIDPGTILDAFRKGVAPLGFRLSTP